MLAGDDLARDAKVFPLLRETTLSVEYRLHLRRRKEAVVVCELRVLHEWDEHGEGLGEKVVCLSEPLQLTLRRPFDQIGRVDAAYL